LLFRYADFIFSVGGEKLQLGLIVGAGMVGSVIFRLIQGAGIDTYGPRKIWLWSCALFVLSKRTPPAWENWSAWRPIGV
jgi:MFS family permease